MAKTKQAARKVPLTDGEPRHLNPNAWFYIDRGGIDVVVNGAVGGGMTTVTRIPYAALKAAYERITAKRAPSGKRRVKKGSVRS